MNYAQPPYAPPPYNPQAQYQPPAYQQNVIDPSGHRPKLRTYFLLVSVLGTALYVFGLGAIIAALVISDKDVSPIIGIGGYLLLLFGSMLIYVRLGIGMYHLHGAWKWLPFEQRCDKNGKRYTPDGVWMLLIPYYNFYWMFVFNFAHCDALERMRLNARINDPAPRDLVMWACILELIPFANIFVGPFLWASYMRRIDNLHEQIMTARPA